MAEKKKKINVRRADTESDSVEERVRGDAQELNDILNTNRETLFGKGVGLKKRGTEEDIQREIKRRMKKK